MSIYTAVGKGMYELAVAPGGLLDEYGVSLTAKGSDVRLLELVATDRFVMSRREQRLSVGL